MLIDLVFKGEKATYELATAVNKFALAVYSALKDGFQPLKDLTAVSSAAIADLIPVMGDFAQIAPELAENKEAFMNSWVKAGEDFYDALVASQQPTPQA